MSAVTFDAIRTVANGSITSSYLVLGAALTHPWRVFKITNNTNGDLLISLNGTTNNMFVPASSFTLYDLSTNAQTKHQMDNLQLAIGTQFYVKYSTAPNSGAVWLEGLFGFGE